MNKRTARQAGNARALRLRDGTPTRIGKAGDSQETLKRIALQQSLREAINAEQTLDAIASGADPKWYDTEGSLSSLANPALDPGSLLALIGHGADPKWTRKGVGVLNRHMDPRNIQILLEHGAPVNGPDGTTSPLHAAVSEQGLASPEAVTILLENGANPDAMDELGNTPLACDGTFGGMNAPALLAHGANPNIRNGNGDPAWVTWLSCAANGTEHRLALLEWILANGADPNQSGFMVPYQTGKQPGTDQPIWTNAETEAEAKVFAGHPGTGLEMHLIDRIRSRAIRQIYLDAYMRRIREAVNHTQRQATDPATNGAIMGGPGPGSGRNPTVRGGKPTGSGEAGPETFEAGGDCFQNRQTADVMEQTPKKPQFPDPGKPGEEVQCTTLCNTRSPYMVAWHLKHGCDANAYSTIMKNTAIHHHDDPRTIKLLAANGADVNEAERNVSRLTPLLRVRRLDSMKALLNAGADAKTTDCRGRNAIHILAMKHIHYPDHQEWCDATDTLIYYGTPVNGTEEHQLRVPLHFFSAEDGDRIDLRKIEHLVSRGADLNARDENGRPAWRAIIGRRSTATQPRVHRPQLLRRLLELGADPNGPVGWERIPGWADAANTLHARVFAQHPATKLDPDTVAKIKNKPVRDFYEKELSKRLANMDNGKPGKTMTNGNKTGGKPGTVKNRI